MKKLLSFMSLCALMLAFLFGLQTQAHAQEQAVTPRRVFSIDAGRKYFSEAQINKIIDDAYKLGFTDLHLILGNDGLRFFLDDMSVTVNDTTYESEAVKTAMTAGNNEYYRDPNGNALTQAEMDRILAKAKMLHINIIPLINTPGHMDAILVGMEQLGMQNVKFAHNGKTSKRTVNLNNEAALTFSKNLVKKYVDYFASKGATDIFNFGADEYANDVFPTPGWGNLQSMNLYDDFITYANDLSRIIKDAGLKPMAFNDGIYYNSRDNFGTFDQDLIISYWTSGWGGFYVAKPYYLSGKGHKILNTNDAWYWVLGNNDSGLYNYSNAFKNMIAKKFNDVTGAGNHEVPIIGSMQCVWCDNPRIQYDDQRASTLMSWFASMNSAIFVKPADFDEVKKALSTVPEDLSLYETESVNALKTVIDSINYGLREDQQDLVDQKAVELREAIGGLVFKPADYTAVDQAIEQANALTKSKYVDFTPVQTAIDAVDRTLNITQQARVDAMAQAITDAVAKYKGLVAAITDAVGNFTNEQDPTAPVVTPAEEASDSTSVSTNNPKPAIPNTSDPVSFMSVVGTLVTGISLTFAGTRIRKNS